MATPLQADQFVDTVGVNVHSTYGATDSTNGYAGNWVPKVTALGVRHVRDNFVADGAGGAACAAAASALSAAGIGVLRILSGGTELSALAAAGWPAPEAVEPWNEHDADGGAWATDLQTFQPTLYAQAKSHWSGVTVLGPSLSNITHASSVGDLTPNLDAVNIHSYAGPSQKPESNTAYLDAVASSTNANITGPSLPHWLTETGWASGSDTAAETTDLAVARIAPRALLRAFSLGIKRTYLYELLDEHTTAVQSPAYEDRFGLYRRDLSAKTSATTIANLLTLLADPGMSFTTTALDVSITCGVPYGSLLMQKRNGEYWLAFWQAGNVTTNPAGDGTPQIAGTDLTEVSHPVTITLGRTFSDVQVFRPMSGTTGTALTAGTATITTASYLDVSLLRLSGPIAPKARIVTASAKTLTGNRARIIHASAQTTAPGAKARIFSATAQIVDTVKARIFSASASVIQPLTSRARIFNAKARVLNAQFLYGIDSSGALRQLYAYQLDGTGTLQRVYFSAKVSAPPPPPPPGNALSYWPAVAPITHGKQLDPSKGKVAGLPPGTVLTERTNLTIDTPGVYSDFSWTGTLKITAPGVTLLRVKGTNTGYKPHVHPGGGNKGTSTAFGMYVLDCPTDTVMIDSEIYGGGSVSMLRGQLYRCIISEGDDLFRISGSLPSEIVESVFDGVLRYDPTDHVDAIQATSNEGSTTVYQPNIRRCWISCYNRWTGDIANAAFQSGGYSSTGGMSGLIEDSYLNGGNYTINYDKPAPLGTGLRLRRNRFGRNYRYGAVSGKPNMDSSNVWDDTGRPISGGVVPVPVPTPTPIPAGVTPALGAFSLRADQSDSQASMNSLDDALKAEANSLLAGAGQPALSSARLLWQRIYYTGMPSNFTSGAVAGAVAAGFKNLIVSVKPSLTSDPATLMTALQGIDKSIHVVVHVHHEPENDGAGNTDPGPTYKQQWRQYQAGLATAMWTYRKAEKAAGRIPNLEFYTCLMGYTFMAGSRWSPTDWHWEQELSLSLSDADRKAIIADSGAAFDIYTKMLNTAGSSYQTLTAEAADAAIAEAKARGIVKYGLSEFLVNNDIKAPIATVAAVYKTMVAQWMFNTPGLQYISLFNTHGPASGGETPDPVTALSTGANGDVDTAAAKKGGLTREVARIALRANRNTTI